MYIFEFIIKIGYKLWGFFMKKSPAPTSKNDLGNVTNSQKGLFNSQTNNITINNSNNNQTIPTSQKTEPEHIEKYNAAKKIQDAINRCKYQFDHYKSPFPKYAGDTQHSFNKDRKTLENAIHEHAKKLDDQTQKECIKLINTLMDFRVSGASDLPSNEIFEGLEVLLKHYLR